MKQSFLSQWGILQKLSKMFVTAKTVYKMTGFYKMLFNIFRRNIRQNENLGLSIIFFVVIFYEGEIANSLSRNFLFLDFANSVCLLRQLEVTQSNKF